MILNFGVLRLWVRLLAIASRRSLLSGRSILLRVSNTKSPITSKGSFYSWFLIFWFFRVLYVNQFIFNLCLDTEKAWGKIVDNKILNLWAVSVFFVPRIDWLALTSENSDVSGHMCVYVYVVFDILNDWNFGVQNLVLMSFRLLFLWFWCISTFYCFS